MDRSNGESTWFVHAGPLTLAVTEILGGISVNLNDKSTNITHQAKLLIRRGIQVHSKAYTSAAKYFFQVAEQTLAQLL